MGHRVIGRGCVWWKARRFLPGEEISDLDKKTAARLADRGIVADTAADEAVRAKAEKEAKKKADAEAKAKADAEAKAKAEADAKAKAAK